jgi:hypothetical protein
VLGFCLSHFEATPGFVRDCCRGILDHWKQEMSWVQKRLAERKKGTTDFFIQKALAHPDLFMLAGRTALDMYDAEEEAPGTLTPKLLQIVTDFMRTRKLPAWETNPEAVEE